MLTNVSLRDYIFFKNILTIHVFREGGGLKIFDILLKGGGSKCVTMCGKGGEGSSIVNMA